MVLFVDKKFERFLQYLQHLDEGHQKTIRGDFLFAWSYRQILIRILTQQLGLYFKWV